MLKKEFSENILKETGLFYFDEKKKIFVERFKNRIIFPINSIIKKIEIITMDPNNPQTILLILKLKIKYIKDNKIIIKKMYPVGVCFVKNDSSKIIGKRNQ